MPIALLLSNWRLILEVVVVGVLVAYGVTMRTQRDIARAEYSDFRREIAKAAQLAAEHALKKSIEDMQRKEKADVENLRSRTALDAATRKLRGSRASSSFVPPAPSCPSRPESACLDRAILERAIRTLDSEVQSLVDEGSRAVIDLDTAKNWAQGQ